MCLASMLQSPVHHARNQALSLPGSRLALRKPISPSPSTFLNAPQRSVSTEPTRHGSGIRRTRSTSHELDNVLPFSDEELQHQARLDSQTEAVRQIILGSKTRYRGKTITEAAQKFAALQPRRNVDDWAQNTERPPSRLNSRIQPDGRRQPREIPGRAQDPSQDTAGDVDQQDRNRKMLSLDLIKFQIRSCKSPEEIALVMHFLMSTRPGQAVLNLTKTQGMIASRLRNRDPIRVLGALVPFRKRFHEANMQFSAELLWLGVTSAAAMKNLPALRDWLDAFFQRTKGHVDSRQLQDLRAALARGADMARSQVLLDLETFFQGLRNLNGEAKSKLVETLPQLDWSFLAGWLAHCKWTDDVLSMWKWYKRQLDRDASKSKENILFRKLAPKYFMEAFFNLGDQKYAWDVFARCAELMETDNITRQVLLDHASSLPEHGMKNRDIAENLIVRALESRTNFLERSLGIEWKSNADENALGWHEPAERSTWQVAAPKMRENYTSFATIGQSPQTAWNILHFLAKVQDRTAHVRDNSAQFASTGSTGETYTFESVLRRKILRDAPKSEPDLHLIDQVAQWSEPHIQNVFRERSGSSQKGRA